MICKKRKINNNKTLKEGGPRTLYKPLGQRIKRMLWKRNLPDPPTLRIDCETNFYRFWKTFFQSASIFSGKTISGI